MYLTAVVPPWRSIQVRLIPQNIYYQGLNILRIQVRGILSVGLWNDHD